MPSNPPPTPRAAATAALPTTGEPDAMSTADHLDPIDAPWDASAVTEDPDAPDDDLLILPRRGPRRMTWALVGLVVLIAGFAGGALVERHYYTAPTTGAGSLAALLGGTGGTGGTGVAAGAGRRGLGGAATGGAAANATVGQVTLVDGHNIYITTADGSVIKVATTATSTIRVNQTATTASIKAGDTVAVQGNTGADGTITATNVVDQGAAAAAGAGAASPSPAAAGG